MVFLKAYVFFFVVLEEVVEVVQGETAAGKVATEGSFQVSWVEGVVLFSVSRRWRR